MVALVNATGPVTGTSLTLLNVTIPATGTGNSLIVCSQSSAEGATNPNITGITLGGSATGWVVAKSTISSTYPSAEIWWVPSAASGQTAIAITYGNGAGSAVTCAYVYEVSGLTTLDKTAGNGSPTGGSPATVSSGATATTTAPAEFWAGMAASYSGSGAQSFTPIGAPPWVNGTQQAQLGGSDMYIQSMAGYQIVSSTGTATYSATITDNSWSAAVATFSGGSGAAGNAVLASGAGAVPGTTTSPYILVSNLKYATGAADLGGNYGSWQTPQFAEGGP